MVGQFRVDSAEGAGLLQQAESGSDLQGALGQQIGGIVGVFICEGAEPVAVCAHEEQKAEAEIE